VKLAKVKWEILDLLGYVFCEVSIRWWDLFDDTPLEGYPTRWNTITYLIGVPSYRAGCFFYGLQDDNENG
jgi:hypothetical protein